MIAVLYQFQLKPDCLPAYTLLWERMVDFLKSERGALGSVLHVLGDKGVAIYSQWPDKSTYETSWPSDDDVEQQLPPDIAQIALQMREFIDGDVQIEIMDVVRKRLV